PRRRVAPGRPSHHLLRLDRNAPAKPKPLPSGPMALTDQNSSGTLTPGEDDQPSFFTPQRIRLLAIGAGVVAVVALGIWFMSVAGNRKEAFAAQALESARMTAEQGNIGEAVQQFEAITTQFSGTAAGYEAAL